MEGSTGEDPLSPGPQGAVPGAPDSRSTARLRRLAQGYLLCVAAFAVAASLLAFRDQYTVPFVDDWRVLDDYHSRPLPAYLFAPQNGHHMPITLALFALDYELLGGRGRLLVAFSLAWVWLAMGAMYGVFGGRDGLAAPGRQLVFGFACFSLLWAVSFHDVLWPLNHHTPQTIAFVFLGLAIAARAESGRALGLAALCAGIATFSFGMGAAAWVGVVVAALASRYRGRGVAAVAVAAVTTVALRAATIPPQPRVSFGESLLRTVTDPLSLTDFSLTLLGAAPARVALGLVGSMPSSPRDLPGWRSHTEDLHLTALAFGAAGLALLAALLYVRWRRATRSSALEAFGFGLMATGFATALLVGFVRFIESGHDLAVRWMAWSTLFWVGAACALVAVRELHRSNRYAAMGALLIPVVSVCMLPALQDARTLHAMKRDQASRLALALLLDVRHDRLAASVALDDAELVYRVATRLEAEGRHPFDDPRRSLRGASFHDHFAEAGSCPEGSGRLLPLATGGAPAAEVSGSVALAAGRPRFLVVTDSAGVIRGLAESATGAPLPRTKQPQQTSWAGFVGHYDASAHYTAWAVLPDGRSACAIQIDR